MIYIKIATLVVLLLFFVYRIKKTGRLDLNCWTISYAFLLIELYAIISYTASGIAVSSVAFPLALCTMGAAIAGFYLNRNVRLKASEAINISNDSPFTTKSVGIIGLVIFFFVLILIGTFRYQGIPPIVDSIKTLFKGGYSYSDALELTEARRLISKAHYFGGEYRGQGLTKTMQIAGWPLLCSTTLGVYLNNKRKSTLIMFILFSIAGIIYLAGDGTRLPALILLVVCFITFCQKRKVNIVKFAKVGIIVLLFMSLLSSLSIKQYSTFSGGISFSSVFESIKDVVDRILLGNTGCDIIAINYVSSGDVPIQYGALHFHQFLNALPGVSVSYKTFSYLLAQLSGASSTTYYSTTYLGIAYADFGFFGAMVVYFILGAVCAISIPYFKKLAGKNDPIDGALSACLTWEIAYVFVRSLIGSLVEIALVVVMYFILKQLCKLRIKNTSTAFSVKGQ